MIRTMAIALITTACCSVFAADAVKNKPDLAKARQIAERFDTLAPGAVQITKQLMKSVDREQLRQVIEEEGALFTQRLRSPEAIAAIPAATVHTPRCV